MNVFGVVTTITPEVIEAWMATHYAQGLALARSRGAGDNAEDVVQIALMYALGRTVRDPVSFIARGIKLQTWREHRRNSARALREQAYARANPAPAEPDPTARLELRELLASLSAPEYDAVMERTAGLTVGEMSPGGPMRLSRMRKRLAVNDRTKESAP